MTFPRPLLVVPFALALIACRPVGSFPGENRAALPGPDRLAQKVFYASGGKELHTVSRIQFSFNVIDNGKTVVSRSHDWNLAAQTATVTTAGKTVSLNLASPTTTSDEKSAFAAWTNDTYWLLMPLKLFDPGVNRTLFAPEDYNGKTYENLQLTFGKTGLTPGDTYHLLIEPKLNRVKFWDYIPSPEKRVRFSWDDYERFGPLLLSTSHSQVNGTRQITLTDITVSTHPHTKK